MPVPEGEWQEIIASFQFFIDNRTASLAPTVSNQMDRLNASGTPLDWVADLVRLSPEQRVELRALLNTYRNPKPSWVTNLRTLLQ